MRTASVLSVAPSPRRAPARASDRGDVAAVHRPSPSRRGADDPGPRPVPAHVASSGPTPLDPDAVARRALDVARRTALGVLAGDVATADDVAQEVAILAVRHAGRLRDPAALDGWLHRTAVRAALRTVRRGRRRRDVEEHHAAVRSRPPAEPSALGELGPLLAGLPQRQRAALTLRYAHDLDDDAIASALGCRAGTVRGLLSRGRAALRERMAAPPQAHPSENSATTGADRA